jgi:hypothetical protein
LPSAVDSHAATGRQRFRFLEHAFLAPTQVRHTPAPLAAGIARGADRRQRGLQALRGR